MRKRGESVGARPDAVLGGRKYLLELSLQHFPALARPEPVGVDLFQQNGVPRPHLTGIFSKYGDLLALPAQDFCRKLRNQSDFRWLTCVTKIMNRPSFFTIGNLWLASCILMSASAVAHPDHDGDASEPTKPPLVAIPETTAPDAALKPTVKIVVEGSFRVIQSNGLPDHAPGTFPRRGNPNTIKPQSYKFRVPLHPKESPIPVHRGGYWWGVALNGVPFEPGTAESWNNDMRSGWRYEAATGFLNLGLDEHNAHVQPNGSYHYHALPNGLVKMLGGDDAKMLLVAWSADGFPVYTAQAYSAANDAKSPLRKMKSSYQLKKGPRPSETNSPSGNYDGHFTQDFEFIKNSGDLDECNGRFGITPEFPEGTYYYCISAEFPFVPRMWRGEPDISFNKGDRPPGGGPRSNSQRQAPMGTSPRGILEDGPRAEPNQRPSTPQGGADGIGLPRMPIVGALDVNHDGVIDAVEMNKAADALKALDANHDGKLTGDEFRGSAPSGNRPRISDGKTGSPSQP